MDTAVRQRLLGGIVLIAGAAILLPLMLDGSGAKLLSRLEALPAKPATATVEQVQPELNQQQKEAEDEVSAAHSEETPFYSLTKPTTLEEDLIQNPEQIVEDLAAKKRTAELLGTTEEITPEQALKQQQEAQKALAMLEAANAKVQQEAQARLTEQQEAEQLAQEKIKKEAEKAKLALEGKLTQDDIAKADKTAIEKAKLEAQAQAKVDKLSQEKKQSEKSAKEDLISQKIAEEKQKAEQAAKEDVITKKLAQQNAKEDKENAKEALAKKQIAEEKAKNKEEKLAAKKQAEAEAKSEAERLAQQKATTKKKEEEKAKLALEGKVSEKSSGEAWVVQVASLSDKAKADAMSSKLSSKGYRSRVVKHGDAWKVVVGPELDKTKAQSLKAKINDDGGLGVSGAWVAPWKP